MDYECILKEAGLRITKPRLHILQALSSSSYPLTVEEIAMLLMNENVEISTIYRTLNALSEAGFVKKEAGVGAESCFSLVKEEDAHFLYCVACQKKIPLEGCPYHEANRQLEADTGFKILDHDTIIKGLCPECQAKQKES